MNKPSMKQIAKLAKVSTTTVSYVLNNKPGISNQTRERVLKIMEQENYLPVKSGRNFFGAETRNLFLIVDDTVSFVNTFYSMMLDSLSVAASKYGYTLSVNRLSDGFWTTTAATAIWQKAAAGFIFLHEIQPDTLHYLQQANVPFVVIDTHKKDCPYPSIQVDCEQVAYLATSHLIDLGHKKLAFIAQKAIPDFYIVTFAGFCRALAEHNLTMTPQWLQPDACDFDSAYQCMEKILAADEQPTAVVCATDFFAYAAMHCVQAHGFRIPEDYSFVGMDDLNLSQIIYPPLSCVHVDCFEMAEKAIEYLRCKIENTPEPFSGSYTIQTNTLIQRKSSAPAD